MDWQQARKGDSWMRSVALPTLFSYFSINMTTNAQELSCRCFPGDDCWPSLEDWSELNSSVSGRLIPTVPLATWCHDPNYDEKLCQSLQENWLNPELHFPSSSSIMAPFFANQSCDPFTSRDLPCVTGTYVQYAVNVTKPEDVSATIDFTKEHNIRIVVRNTGHEYNGKSTGAGSLGIWTHHLKDMSLLDFTSPSYQGKAIKLGAGVQGFEASRFAHDHGLIVVGGECETVGIAGGYTQGGGHSAIGSKYGLAADQTLEFEVVDGNGNYLIANRAENSDLYWALSGGGGGTYGVVLSMTIKAYDDVPTSGAKLSFTSEGIGQDTFYKAITSFHSALPSIVDAGVMVVYFFSNSSFAISPMTGPGVAAAEIEALLKPFTDDLVKFNITYSSSIQSFPGYFEFFENMFDPILVGTTQFGSRLIPRSVVLQNNNELTEAYRSINNEGGQFIGVGINVSKSVAGDVDNSVHPAWRDVLIVSIITTEWKFDAPWSEMIANQEAMTNRFIPLLKQLTPGGGAYLNEADWKDPDWKEAFYGPNYDRLLEIKNKYDPDHVFYGATAVGSDYWFEATNKRLCKT